MIIDNCLNFIPFCFAYHIGTLDSWLNYGIFHNFELFLYLPECLLIWLSLKFVVVLDVAVNVFSKLSSTNTLRIYNRCSSGS